MKTASIKSFLTEYLFKWILICLITGALVGTVSAFFLFALDWVGSYREAHLWIIGFLPLAGMLMVFAYKKWGKGTEKGNDLVLEAYSNSYTNIPLRMAPMILFSTLVSHLFGASVGREGTAIQYGASISNQFIRLFSFTKEEKRTLVLIGIASGFASLFGTPWAGTIFALEVVRAGKFRWKAIVPILLTSFLANQVCLVWNAHHTSYSAISNLPDEWLKTLAYSLGAGVLFGLAAMLFVYFGKLFKKAFGYFANPYIAPIIGGLIIILSVYALGSSKYIGLGIPTIKDAFAVQLPTYDFLIKIILTTLCLRAGFKGGEVTPLFFIGATLGNALFLFIPLPMDLLAGLGFVAVFAACTKTPLACTIMGIELFGMEPTLYFAAACFVAYYVSTSYGIYQQRHRLPYYFSLSKN
ncbi:chloride channel protein [Sphingobacterium hungaricum]